MIRTALHRDVSRLKALWHLCFDDSHLYVERFFDHCFVPDNTLVYEVAGKVTSVVYLIPGHMDWTGKNRTILYLYACGTDPEWQGKGQMAQLLEEAYRVGIEREVYALTLITAENSLLDYYSRHGFQPLPSSYSTVLSLTHKDARIPFSTVPLTPSDLDNVRRRCFPSEGFVHWNKNHYKLLLEDIEDSKGGALKLLMPSYEGYILYFLTNEGVNVIEWGVTDHTKYDEWINLLPVIFAEKGRVLLAKMPGFEMENEVERSRGMIRLCKEDNSARMNEGIFLNLGLSD